MGWGWEEGCSRERKSGEEEARMNLWAATLSENNYVSGKFKVPTPTCFSSTMKVMSVKMLLSLSMLEVVPRLVENWCHLRDTGPCGSMLDLLGVLSYFAVQYQSLCNQINQSS